MIVRELIEQLARIDGETEIYLFDDISMVKRKVLGIQVCMGLKGEITYAIRAVEA